MPQDKYANFVKDLTSPICGGAPITPDDAAHLPIATRAINVATPGHITVTLLDGDVVTLFVAAGILMPVRVTRVWQTGTDATGIVGVY